MDVVDACGNGERVIADGKAFLVAGVDAEGNRLTAEWIRRPVKNAQILLAIVLQGDVQGRRGAARRELPCPTPVAPDSVGILGANVPVVFAIGIQLARCLERVASRAG